MITGTSQADTAVLVIDSTTGGFEGGISEQGQNREHALLTFTLGIKQMIVAVNKIDDKTVNYSQKRFNEINVEMTCILTNIGFTMFTRSQELVQFQSDLLNQVL